MVSVFIEHNLIEHSPLHGNSHALNALKQVEPELCKVGLCKVGGARAMYS